MPEKVKLLTKAEVIERTGLSESSIWRLRRDNDFPIPVRLGPGGLRFYAHEIEQWLSSRPRVSEGRRKRQKVVA